VFCTLLRHWSRQFSKEVDAHTVEVADYTVVIKGLPEVDPVEVGGWQGDGVGSQQGVSPQLPLPMQQHLAAQ